MAFLRVLTLSLLFLKSSHSFLSFSSPEKERFMSTHLAVNHVDSVRVLSFGDSLTAGTSPPDYNLHPYSTYLEDTLNRSNNSISSPILVRHKGYPGFTASQLVEYAQLDGGLAYIIEKIQNPPLSMVLLLAGTNDLAYETSSDKIFKSITNLHQICHDKGVPHTIAIAIPPSGYQAQVKSVGDLVKNINQSIESYCLAKPDRMTFFPFPFDFQRGDDRFCTDGLHFTKKGYEQLAEALAPVVSQILKKRLHL